MSSRQTWPETEPPQPPRAEAVLAPYRPTERHVVLATVGVARSQQRRGLGARVLGPGLARADAAGLLVHLETSADSHVRWYQRLGFEVVEVVDIPADGPRTWLMHRRPGRGRATEPGS